MTAGNDTPATRPATKHKPERRIKVTSRYDNNKAVPWVQMRGQWLEQIGFTIDTPIKIRVMDGCLVLTIEKAST